MKRYINAYIDKYPYKRLNAYICECLLNTYIDKYAYKYALIFIKCHIIASNEEV